MTNILIVDDDKEDRMLIARRLSKTPSPPRLIEAACVDEALEMIAQFPVDIVLLDLTLLESDGLDTLRHFQRFASQLPIVVLTGVTDDAIALQAIKLGAQDFVRKTEIDNPWLHRSIGNALQRHGLQAELKHISSHDSLTRLPNRLSFEGRLEETFENNSCKPEEFFSVVFIDLDEFKLINDCYGHCEGDRVLVEFANRVKGCVRSIDTVARFGGDEFVVLLNSVKSDNDIQKFVDRVNAALEEPMTIDGNLTFLSASIGYVSSCEQYEEFKHMLRDADTAMYAAKKFGKRTHRRFSKTMRENAVQTVGLDTWIRQALVNDEFEVYYQPIVDLRTGQAISLEALIRWNHPVQGMIPPLNFIPHAERSGLIAQLGEWVLSAVCKQIVQWDEQYPGCMISVNVNVSPNQVQLPGFADSVFELLDRHQLTGERITLEITESTIMDNREVTIDVLQQIRANGTQISIDDFGTGHSSLAKLHRFGFDSLKIDRSFVQDLLTDGYADLLVKTILLLAESIGLDVVAEGIETPQEADRLREMGCTIGQGYFYGRPMPSSQADLVVSQIGRTSGMARGLSMPKRNLASNRDPVSTEISNAET